MPRKSKTPPETFTSDESFHYHLTELELIVASGTITWSATSANAARRRLDRLSATLDEVVNQLEDE